MKPNSRHILQSVIVVLIAFSCGTISGVRLYPTWFGADVVVEEDAEAHPAHAEEHIDLTVEAVANLNLSLGAVEIGDYWETQTLPGEVVEIPGKSDLSVSAPVSGVVEQVSIRPGESVGIGSSIFRLRITDPNLTAAQANLLGVLAKISVAKTEIDRLAPYVQDGTVSQTKKRELEYEVRRLTAESQTKMQEILAYGLPRSALENVIQSKQLATHLSISVPDYDLDASAASNVLREVSIEPAESFSISAIHAHPGLAVQTGAHLCDLSYHGQLYLKGQAFESDVPAIMKMTENNWKVSAEFGHQHYEGHQHAFIRKELSIARLDNHVDATTQTFAFYIPLENEVVQEVTNDDRVYRQWRFRPGQRVHLRVPVAKHESKIKIPVQALVMEGPNAIVFRATSHSHDHSVEDIELMVGIGGVGMELEDDHDDDHAGHNHATGDADPHNHHADDENDHNHTEDDHDHDHAEVFLQLEPVPVHVLHRGHDFAIIEVGGELAVGDEIALNAAYKLQLALKMQSGSSDAHHGHEH